jgi:hypothetical protein
VAVQVIVQPRLAFCIVVRQVQDAGTDVRAISTVATLVIDLESDGITRSGPLDLMSFRGMPLGELTFNDVKVPAGSALKVAGFKGMMEGINLARVDAASYGCGFIRTPGPARWWSRWVRSAISGMVAVNVAASVKPLVSRTATPRPRRSGNRTSWSNSARWGETVPDHG